MSEENEKGGQIRVLDGVKQCVMPEARTTAKGER